MINSIDKIFTKPTGIPTGEGRFKKYTETL